jgi:hypothetical protein
VHINFTILFTQENPYFTLHFTSESRYKKLSLYFTHEYSHINFSLHLLMNEARGSLVAKELGYKQECRGFDTRGGKILNLPNSSGRTRPWGLFSL